MTNQQLIFDVRDFGDINLLIFLHMTSQQNQEDGVWTNVGRLQQEWSIVQYEETKFVWHIRPVV